MQISTIALLKKLLHLINSRNYCREDPLQLLLWNCKFKHSPANSAIQWLSSNEQGYNGFPQIIISFNLSWINHRLLVIIIWMVATSIVKETQCSWHMDRLKCFCEIEKISGSDSCCQITDFIHYMHSRNLGGTIIIDYDISLSQLLLCKNSKFKRICGSNCSYIIENGSFIKWVTATEIGN